MKKIMGLLVILAVLALGGYYGMGLVTERTLKRNIEAVNQTSGLLVNLKHYNRHWFGSDAAVDVRIHVAERVIQDDAGKSVTVAAENYTLDVPVMIEHGPLMMTGTGVLFGLGYAQSHLNLPKEWVEKFSTMFAPESTRPELNLSVFVNYVNKTRLSLGIPAFKLISKEGKGTATWLGMMGQMAISSDLSVVDGGITLDGLQIEKDKMKAQLGPVSTEYDLHKAQDGLYLGQARLSVPSLNVSDDNKPLFELNQFKARVDTNIDQGLFHSETELSLDHVLSNERNYGPGFLNVTLKNLDAAVLVTIKTQANKMNHATGAERQQALFAILPEVPKLFGKGARLELTNLKLTVPEGQIDGHFSLALPVAEGGNPFQLLQKIEGEGRFQIPSLLVKTALVASIVEKGAAVSSPQAAMMASENKTQPGTTAAARASGVDATQQAVVEADKKLASLIQAKVLIENGADYVLAFQLSAGKLTVNGLPFDPSTFKL